jgi:hypothetical protein
MNEERGLHGLYDLYDFPPFKRNLIFSRVAETIQVIQVMQAERCRPGVLGAAIKRGKNR